MIANQTVMLEVIVIFAVIAIIVTVITDNIKVFIGIISLGIATQYMLSPLSLYYKVITLAIALIIFLVILYFCKKIDSGDKRDT